jgi:hypothetical protein
MIYGTWIKGVEVKSRRLSSPGEPILVVTDVAARIDVPLIDHVIHYHFLHRRPNCLSIVQALEPDGLDTAGACANPTNDCI